jgi:acyl-CoA thioesterase
VSGSTPTPTRFDRDTAVTSLGDGRFGARIDRGWWVLSGPHGGYLAAIALRAMQEGLADSARAPRSLHVRYLKAPVEGAAEVRTRVVRAGRSLTVMEAELWQGEAELVRASATFSGAFSEIAFQDAPMPVALPRSECPPIVKAIPVNSRYDMWRAIGDEFRQGERAVTGGWIRLEEPRLPDALLLAALWDAWPPAAFARAMDARFRGAVPTVEVSVYFRESFPVAGLAADDHLLLRVETLKAQDGIADESGEIWSPGGRLLAQSRQLALLY